MKSKGTTALEYFLVVLFSARGLRENIRGGRIVPVTLMNEKKDPPPGKNRGLSDDHSQLEFELEGQASAEKRMNATGATG